MDEAGVRTLLDQLADTEPPPARVDLDAAIAAGRRGRRWRRMRGGILALAAAGAVAAVVAALLVVPAQRPGHQAAGSTVTPARFNVLVPYASFGWLPPGFQTGAAGGTMPASTPVRLNLVAVSHGAFIELLVNPAGTCHVAGRALLCSAYNTMNAVRSRAPDVRGHLAYWLLGGSWPGSTRLVPGPCSSGLMRTCAGRRPEQSARRCCGSPRRSGTGRARRSGSPTGFPACRRDGGYQRWTTP